MAEEEIKLEDVFDMDFLQSFQDSFARAAGMTAVTVDKDGKPVTRPTDWSEFCMKYTRGTAEGCRRCEQCDKNGGETAAVLVSQRFMSAMRALWILVLLFW